MIDPQLAAQLRQRLQRQRRGREERRGGEWKERGEEWKERREEGKERRRRGEERRRREWPRFRPRSRRHMGETLRSPLCGTTPHTTDCHSPRRDPKNITPVQSTIYLPHRDAAAAIVPSRHTESQRVPARKEKEKKKKEKKRKTPPPFDCLSRLDSRLHVGELPGDIRRTCHYQEGLGSREFWLRVLASAVASP